MKIIQMGFVTFLCGAVIIAISIYMERRNRRPDPAFRRKLKDRRIKLKKQHLPHFEIVPNDYDPKFREAIIINEIQVAEQLMYDKKTSEALPHFAQAIAVCADPEHLLNCLRQTLPPASYDTLIDFLVQMYGNKYNDKRDIFHSEIATSLAF